MSSIKPFSPEDVSATNAEKIPPLVIEAVNELLVKNSQKYNYTIILEKDEVVDAIYTKLDAHNDFHTRAEIFEKGYLNFEPLFRDAGWLVNYYSYDSTSHFKFTPKEIGKHE